MSYRPNSDRVFAMLYDEEGVLYAKGVFEGHITRQYLAFFQG